MTSDSIKTFPFVPFVYYSFGVHMRVSEVSISWEQKPLSSQEHSKNYDPF